MNCLVIFGGRKESVTDVVNAALFWIYTNYFYLNLIRNLESTVRESEKHGLKPIEISSYLIVYKLLFNKKIGGFGMMR